MGNFSYLCKECDCGIQENDECVLFLLDKGVIVEKMCGKYNGYGCVYKEDGIHYLLKEARSTPEEAPELKDAFIWEYDKWSNLTESSLPGWIDEDGYVLYLELHDTGWAAYHKQCYHGQLPKLCSMGDPNQGWGKGDEYYEEDNNNRDMVVTWFKRKIQLLEKCLDEDHPEYLPQIIYRMKDDLADLEESRLYLGYLKSQKERADARRSRLPRKRPISYRKR